MFRVLLQGVLTGAVAIVLPTIPLAGNTRQDISPQVGVAELSILSDSLRLLPRGVFVPGRGRKAILVAADETRGNSSWALPFASRNVEALNAALIRSGGFRGRDVTRLTGERVLAETIERSIMDAASSFSGPDNLLVLYYTGHGGILPSQEPFFFTNLTHFDSQRQLESVIKESDLIVWIARAQREAAKSRASFRVLMIVDACRAPILATAVEFTSNLVGDWRLYSAPPNGYAPAPTYDAATPFTRAVASSLDSLSLRVSQARLSDWLGRVDRTARRAGSALIWAGEEEGLASLDFTHDPVIIDRAVHVGIKVVDGVSGESIANYELRINDITQQGPVVRMGLRQRNLLEVRAPGYLTRIEDWLASRDADGQTLEIPVHPEMALVVGSIYPTRDASDVWIGETRLPGYFATEVPVDARGRFVLRIPPPKNGGRLRIIDATRRVIGEDVSLSWDRRTEIASLRGEYRIPLLDVGPVRVETGSGRVLRPDDEPILAEVPLPQRIHESPSTAPTLVDDLSRLQFESAERFWRQRQWRLARENVIELIDAHAYSSPDDRELLTIFLARLAASEALDDDSPHFADSLARVIGAMAPIVEHTLRAVSVQRMAEAGHLAALATPGRGTDAVRYLRELHQASEWGFRNATQGWEPVAQYASQHFSSIVRELFAKLLERERFREALRFSDQIKTIRMLEYLRVVEARALELSLRREIEIGVTSGSWETADALARRASRDFAGDSVFVALVKELARERIPLATRETFARARVAERVSYEEAWLEYGRALEGANVYYRAQISRARGHVRQLLFQKYRVAGESHFQVGQDSAALDNYLRASLYDMRVSRRIEVLVAQETPADRQLLAEWRRRERIAATTPSRIQVIVDSEVDEVWIGGRSLGALAAGSMAVQGRVAPTDSLVIRVRRRGQERIAVTEVPPNRLITVRFEIPLDTLTAHRPSTVGELTMVFNARAGREWRPSRAAPVQIEVPKSQDHEAAKFLGLLSLGGGIYVGIKAGPALFLSDAGDTECDSSCSRLVGGLVLGLGGLVVGGIIGGAIDRTIYRSQVRRSKNYPSQLAEWNRQNMADRRTWVDRQVAAAYREEQARFAREAAQNRQANARIRAHNAGLRPEPQITIEVLNRNLPSRRLP